MQQEANSWRENTGQINQTPKKIDGERIGNSGAVNYALTLPWWAGDLEGSMDPSQGQDPS